MKFIIGKKLQLTPIVHWLVRNSDKVEKMVRFHLGVCGYTREANRGCTVNAFTGVRFSVVTYLEEKNLVGSSFKS